MTPSSSNRAALVPKTGMSSHELPKADRLRTSWRAHVAAGVLRPAPLELVDRDDVGEVEHVDLLELGGGTELRGHHVEREVDERHDRGVALADARRLDDHEVVAGGPAGGDRVGQVSRQLGGRAPGRDRAEVGAAGRQGVHPDPVAEERAPAATPGRVDGEDGDPQLVLLIEAEAADELVGERALARPPGAGDAEDRHLPARGRRRAGPPPAPRPVPARATVMARARAASSPVSTASADGGCAARSTSQAATMVLTMPARPRRWPSAGVKICDATLGERTNLLVDDDAAAPAEDLDVAGAALGAAGRRGTRSTPGGRPGRS